MKPFVRLASRDDIPACSRLLGILFEQENEFGADPQKQERGIGMIMDNPEKGLIFVCETDGTVQGMVMLLFTISTFLGEKVAILEDMIISEEWRGKGIGSLMLDTAIEHARKDGFARITLLTDYDNNPAHRFYTSRGFAKSDMIVFRKMLQ